MFSGLKKWHRTLRHHLKVLYASAHLIWMRKTRVHAKCKCTKNAL